MFHSVSWWDEYTASQLTRLVSPTECNSHLAVFEPRLASFGTKLFGRATQWSWHKCCRKFAPAKIQNHDRQFSWSAFSASRLVRFLKLYTGYEKRIWVRQQQDRLWFTKTAMKGRRKLRLGCKEQLEYDNVRLNTWSWTGRIEKNCLNCWPALNCNRSQWVGQII